MTAHIPEAFYIVADHGRLGRETIIDWEACSKADAIKSVFELNRPLQVHCIDRDGGRWRDVSEDVAREIATKLREEYGADLRHYLQDHSGINDFLERHMGCHDVANLCREYAA